MKNQIALALLFISTLAFAGSTVEVGPPGIPIYPTAASFPTTAPDGTTAVARDDHSVYVYDAGISDWIAIEGGGGGGGGMVIGDAITSATAKSVLFAGTGGVLAQDNANFAWDSTNHRLGIGTATPTNPLQLVQANASGTGFVLQVTTTGATGNGQTIQHSGSGRGMLIQQTASGTGRGLEVTSSNAANTNTAVVITGTHAGYGLAATTSAGSAQNYTGTFNNLSTSAPGVSGGVYGSVRSSASDLTGGVIGEVIGSGIGSGFFAVRNSAGTSIGLATNLGAGVRISPPYSMDPADNYSVELPATQGGAGTTLVNDGAGSLSWVVPTTAWETPGTIGSTTPNTGAFTTLDSQSIDTTATKTTTTSETMNSLSVDYAPTAALSDVNTLSISSSVSTAETVNSLTGINMTMSSDPGSSIATLNPISVTGNVGPVGTAYLLNATPNIESSTNLNAVNIGGTWGDVAGVTAFNVGPNITSQSDGSWQLVNEGPQITQANAISSWSHHPDVTDVTFDYEMLTGGASVDNVGRNVNTFNIHNNMQTVNNSFTGFAEGSNAGTVVGGEVTSFRANTTASVPGNASMYTAFPTITQRAAANQITELTAQADVAGSLGGKYVRICTAYSENPNTCFKIWIDVANGSTPPSADGDTLLEVDIAANDSAATIATAIAAVADPEAKLDSTAAGDVVTLEVVANGRAGGLDTGSIDGWEWTYTQGGGGDGYLYGYSFGAGSSSGYDADHIIAFDSGGYPVNFGRINAFTNYTLVSSTPNPANVHTIGANVTVGDSQTVTDGDVIGVGGIGQISVGDGSTITSGGLKVGVSSAGKISLMQAGTGSTMENVTSDLAASILVSGSGTFENVTGYRAVNANFGASTPMTNYRAFFADTPAGPGAATNTWALYAGGDFVNWIGGGLKIGGTAGVSDQPTSGIDLEVDGPVLLNDAGGTGGNVPHEISRVSDTSAASATCSKSCGADEIVTGGGCQNSLSSVALATSYPSADDTWSCEYGAATGDCTAWAICAKY